ncbi:MAG: hypothetical protein IKP45_03135 [Bacteroidales bacterium]|nr:hypothetical protein [Bacteroidales bacterium]
MILWTAAIAVYVVVNIMLMFMLMYDDVQRGGSGKPGKHPVLFVVVFVLFGLPLLIIYALVEFVRRNFKR